ncbi:MAG: hypothetical protein AB7D51_15750 [Desulfovibrionaceae bacterium]
MTKLRTTPAALALALALTLAPAAMVGLATPGQALAISETSADTSNALTEEQAERQRTAHEAKEAEEEAKARAAQQALENKNKPQGQVITIHRE